jgi:DNA processing protein
VLRILAAGPRHIDEVAREAGLPVASVSSSLQLFELQGTVRQTAPMTYALA